MTLWTARLAKRSIEPQREPTHHDLDRDAGGECGARASRRQQPVRASEGAKDRAHEVQRVEDRDRAPRVAGFRHARQRADDGRKRRTHGDRGRQDPGAGDQKTHREQGRLRIARALNGRRGPGLDRAEAEPHEQRADADERFEHTVYDERSAEPRAKPRVESAAERQA